MKKEICQRCICERRPRGWTLVDENLWVQKQTVLCPWSVVREPGLVLAWPLEDAKGRTDPPSWCCYLLEQLVLGQRRPLVDRVLDWVFRGP
jgi:hypothetical protein